MRSRAWLGWTALAVGMAGALVGSAPRAATERPADQSSLTTLSTLLNDDPATAAAVPSTDGTVGAWAPAVLRDLGPVVRTCRTWRGHGTPTSLGACTGWDGGGPLNLVVIGVQGTDPVAAVERARGWRPAIGGWLVAEARAEAGPAGCAPGWMGSGAQVEQRLNPVTRHHFKLVTTTCATGAAGRVRVVMGEAHTDVYDVRRCHGDHSVGWDAARDRLVAALRAQGHVHVVYVRVHAPGAAFAAGCGQSVRSDGRVAYVFLDPPKAAAPRA